jgi:diguanylate cyclase (GGDEF)-like protein
VIVCDIDYFEHYNDAHGQMHGDVCLRNIAGQLDAAARSRGALVARIGGERFAVLLRQSNVEAVRFAEELRETIERLCIAHSKSPVSGFVTASFGVSSTDSHALDLLQRAQAALQEAKRSGRNRVCADQPAAAVGGITPGTTRSEEPRSLKSAHV